jgi:hypothetical protein
MLCRGKGLKTLGKRPHDKILAGKAVFAECYFSGTRQRLCRVSTLGKDKNEKKNKKNSRNKRDIFLQEANAR